MGWVYLALFAVGIAALWALCLAAGAYLIAYRATHPPRKAIRNTPESLGAPYEEIQMAAADGVPLSGWFVPSSDARPTGVVILCHGMAAHREEMLRWLPALREAGLAALLFDFRASGRSGGARCTGGYEEPADLRGTIDYLSQRSDTAGLPIGVFGFSMGGAVALLTAAEDARIQAVAGHGVFTCMRRAVRQRCRHHFGYFGPIVERIVLWVGYREGWFPCAPEAIAPLAAVAQLGVRPLLLLHGAHDPIVPPCEARALHAAACGPRALRLLPRAGHSHIPPSLRLEVSQQVAAFFIASLGTPGKESPSRQVPRCVSPDRRVLACAPGKQAERSADD